MRTPRHEPDAVVRLIGYIDYLMRQGRMGDRELEMFAETLDPDSFPENSSAQWLTKENIRSLVNQLGSSRERATTGLLRLARRHAQAAARKAREQARLQAISEGKDKKVDAWGGICEAIAKTYRLFVLIGQTKPDDRDRHQQLLETAFIQSRDGVSVFISVCPKTDPFRLIENIPGNSSLGVTLRRPWNSEMLFRETTSSVHSFCIWKKTSCARIMLARKWYHESATV